MKTHLLIHFFIQLFLFYFLLIYKVFLILREQISFSASYIYVCVCVCTHTGDPQMAQWVKSFPVSTGDAGSIPESGRFLGGGHGNPLKFSCLENPMDRGAWWATVHRVSQRPGRD